MSKKEKVNKVLRPIYHVLDVGRLWGKTEAYEYMVDLLRKSHFKKTNPKLLLTTLCLCLDSGSDALEKANKYTKDVSPTLTRQISILINTITALSDNIRIATSEKNYEEAFKHIEKAKREMETFEKANKDAFQVFMEVQRKRLEDMFT